MFAVFCVLVLLINVVGTTYDIVTSTRDSKQGNKYLLAFSIKKNWSKLVAPSGVGPEPRLERLKSINAIRTLTMVCVVLSHTILMAVFSYVENPHKVEEGYGKPEMFLVYNGTLTTCTFFMLSGFLLTYNFVIYTETHRVSYSYILNGLLLRWIRLTPSYALVLGLLATWMRFAGDGPLWDYVVTYESTACRSYWWAHLLYINNYIYDRDQCAPQSCGKRTSRSELGRAGSGRTGVHHRRSHDLPARPRRYRTESYTCSPGLSSTYTSPATPTSPRTRWAWAPLFLLIIGRRRRKTSLNIRSTAGCTCWCCRWV
ncbi:unnamed protein product [Leptidea sinapis]|nr:unnamed protein product [Leptidea sinapis]